MKNHAKNNKDACFSPLLPKATETDAIIITISVIFIAFCVLERNGDYYEKHIVNRSRQIR